MELISFFPVARDESPFSAPFSRRPLVEYFSLSLRALVLGVCTADLIEFLRPSFFPPFPF